MIQNKSNVYKFFERSSNKLNMFLNDICGIFFANEFPIHFKSKIVTIFQHQKCLSNLWKHFTLENICTFSLVVYKSS